MTLDGAPYIGLYSPRLPRLYSVTGFNKWGMTSSMAAATLVTDLILGRDTPIKRFLLPPAPFSAHSWPQMLEKAF